MHIYHNVRYVLFYVYLHRQNKKTYFKYIFSYEKFEKIQISDYC